MAKKKGLTYEQKLINALSKIPNPLEDKKHRIFIYFVNNRARSNQNRFEHISFIGHELRVSDMERIARCINSSTLMKDSKRKDTFNLYIKRNGYNNELIKISLELNFSKSNKGVVKTIFITTTMK